MGDIRENYDGVVKKSQNIYIPEDLLQFGSQQNFLVIEIYPVTGEKAPFSFIRLGEYSRVESAVFWRNLIGVNFSQLTAGISIIERIPAAINKQTVMVAYFLTWGYALRVFVKKDINGEYQLAHMLLFKMSGDSLL